MLFFSSSNEGSFLLEFFRIDFPAGEFLKVFDDPKVDDFLTGDYLEASIEFVLATT